MSEEKVLYRNSSGKGVTHSSYSSRQTFRHCPREFYLTRTEGWSDKEKRAAPLFGKAVEAGVQAYEESARQPGKGVEVFTRLWEAVKTTADYDKLIYTASEGDWDGLLRAGTDMMKLYAIRAPELPMQSPRFQQQVRKLIFPGTHLGNLENLAYFDVISYPPWDHPMLSQIPPPSRQDAPGGVDEPKTGLSTTEPVRPLIIDIKTSGMGLDPKFVALDPQLAEYAWMAGIPDVAFLWFVKHSHGFKKGTKVTLLKDWDDAHAGDQLYVLLEPKADDEFNPNTVYLGDVDALRLFDEGVKGLRGKLLEAKKDEFRQAKFVFRVKPEMFTKQEMIFAAARITEEQMTEIGRDLAQTTVEMVRAHEEGYYPKLAGIRFPNQKCNFCSMRYICLGDSEGRDKNLTRRGEEWLDGADGEW